MVAVLAFVLGVSGCGRKSKPIPDAAVEETPSGKSSETSATPASPTTPPARPPQKRVAVSTKPPPTELWKEFGGRRALETAGKLVALGPRPAGSPEIEAARGLLSASLENSLWEVERVPFESMAPLGPVGGVNLVARFSAEGIRPVPRLSRAILIVAAYDTRSFSTLRFVGANDGASGPAMLVELARVFSLNPRLAERVELLFSDASEPRQQFSPTDGLAGTRAYLNSIDSKSLRRVLVLGGVGAENEQLTVPPATPADIWQEATQGCASINRPNLLRKLDRYMWGDHVPFHDRGVPTLYLGNHDYPARYTADDKMDRLSASTMEQVGQFATWLIAHWAQR
jgi:glutaminyl-peptide cyclotransferase